MHSQDLFSSLAVGFRDDLPDDVFSLDMAEVEAGGYEEIYSLEGRDAVMASHRPIEWSSASEKRLLIHFTDRPGEVLATGLNGSTTFGELVNSYGSVKSKKGINYAYRAEDPSVIRSLRAQEGFAYGNHAWLFFADHGLIYHRGDEEEQVIFDGATVDFRHCVRLERDPLHYEPAGAVCDQATGEWDEENWPMWRVFTPSGRALTPSKVAWGEALQIGREQALQIEETRRRISEACMVLRNRYAARGIKPEDVGNGHCVDFAEELLELAFGSESEAEAAGVHLVVTENFTVDGEGEAWDWDLLERTSLYTPLPETDQSRWDRVLDAGPAHAWVMADGRHFDAMHPHGVSTLFELDFFIRHFDIVSDMSPPLRPISVL